LLKNNNNNNNKIKLYIQWLLRSVMLGIALLLLSHNQECCISKQYWCKLQTMKVTCMHEKLLEY